MGKIKVKVAGEIIEITEADALAGNPFRYLSGGLVKAIKLVDPDDPDATPIHCKVGGVVKAWGKSGVGASSKGYIGLGYPGGGSSSYYEDFWEYNPSGDSWTQIANYGGGKRVESVGFGIGSKGYVGTGSAGSGCVSDFWEYDPTTNLWTQKLNYIGVPVFGPTGFGIGTKGYVGIGYDEAYNYDKSFYEYNPITNTWSTLTSFGGSPKAYATGFKIGTKIYVGTGIDDNWNDTKDFWEYDTITNGWSQKTDVPGLARYAAVGFSIGTKGYIGTGYQQNSWPFGYLKDFYEYDPATNIWTQKTDFAGVARYAAVSFNIGNKGYIGTGGDNDRTYKDFYEYDAALNTWTKKADFGGVVRQAATGFSIEPITI